MLFEDKKFIGLKLKQARSEANLSQGQLAEKIGISEKHISNIERGLNFPSLDTFFRLCIVLNLSLEYFGIEISSESNRDKEAVLEKIYAASEKTLKTYLLALNFADEIAKTIK